MGQDAESAVVQSALADIHLGAACLVVCERSQTGQVCD